MRAISFPRPQVPLVAAWALRRLRELLELTPVGGPARLESGEGPTPPRRLRARAGTPDVREYREGGVTAATELAAALRRAGADLGTRAAILDFGCGAGRVLPHVAGLAPGADCSGCDVDRDAIDWAVAHRPGLDWALSSFEPPLPFGAESFDLVYSVSVFSHLGRGPQDRWLAELARVLRPGGVALLSVHGPSAFEAFRTGRVRTAWCPRDVFDREPLREHDFVFTPYVHSPWTAADLPGVGRDYGLAFHGHGFIRETWGRHLAVREIAVRAVTGGQDLVIATRP
jgi:SAM-dependent methyltransferase